MHRVFLTALAACSLPLAAGAAHALDPAPEGAVKTVNFRVTVQERSATQFTSTAIEHVLNAQCSMIAWPASQIGWDGPTAEQQAAQDAAAARGDALSQELEGSQDFAARVAAEAEKCGDDEACLTAMAMQLAKDPALMEQREKATAVTEAMATLQPDLGPVRYQQWQSQGCTGDLQANDTYVTSDPGGEGGAGAYTDTLTIAATGALDGESWQGLRMQIDLIDGTTAYKVMAPAPITLPSNSSLDGAGTRKVDLLGSTALPVFGPYPGGPGGHTDKANGKDGSITVEWSQVD